MSIKESFDSNKNDVIQKLKIWVPISLMAMILIYILLMVIFGGMGGHKFSFFSRLSFLDNSSVKYYASEAEMARARASWQRSAKSQFSDPVSAAKQAPYKPIPITPTGKAKNGIVLYSHDYERRRNLEVAAEAQAAALRAEQNGKDSDEGGSQSDQEPSPDQEQNANLSEEEEAEARKQGRKVLAAVDEKSERIKQLNSREDESELPEEEIEEDGQKVRKKVIGEENQNANLQSIEIASKQAKNSESLSSDTFSFDQPSFRSKPVTHAFNVGIASVDASVCTHLKGAGIANVFFRKGRSAIKSFSLDGLDSLIALQRDCDTSKIIIMAEPSAADDSDGDTSLYQRRQDEIKYYLLHRRVEREAIATMEEL